MKEDFLHFVWRTKHFDYSNLKTTLGESIQIIYPGQWNQSDGPDFQNARINIQGTTWAGHVEIHLKSSDWLAHRHQEDSRYDNVILHVVYEDDVSIFRRDQSLIPCLCLKKYIPQNILAHYQLLMSSENWIPCEKIIHKVPNIVIKNWLDQVLVSRLEMRCEQLEMSLKSNDGDVEAVFYQSLARAFGLKNNADAMEELAQKLPFKTLIKYRNDLMSMEALLFGTAGFLQNRSECSWQKELLDRYLYLAHKHSLRHTVPYAKWSFGRVRPQAFPTLRIAQLAALYHEHDHLFSQIMISDNLSELYRLFRCRVSPFWRNHYHFNTRNPSSRSLNLGKNAFQLLVINTLAPFLFLYGKIRCKPELQDKAIRWIKQIPPEINHITRQWERLSIPAQNAADSQALIHLKNHFCQCRKCVHCQIGSYWMLKT